MFHMFKKVNAKERILGFYSTGPSIRSNDLRIFDIVERYTSSGSGQPFGSSDTNSGHMLHSSYPAIFSIIDVRPDRSDLPVTSYTVTEQINTSTNSTVSSSNNGTKKQQQQTIERIFVHVPTSLGAVEAEEVGVEHLLRDIHDPTISTIASLIQEKITGLQTLHTKLLVCQQYIQSHTTPTTTTNSTDSTTPASSSTTKVMNPKILANLQLIVSLLPNTIHISNTIHHISMMQQTNDMYMSIYIASLLRTVMAIHNLIHNQIKYGTDGTMSIDATSADSSNNNNNTNAVVEVGKK